MTNTYKFPGKEDVRITVGDEKQADFFPRMKIKRWDNEVNFSVGIISTFQGSHDKVGDKVEWNDGHGVSAKFYEKPDDQFEFEIILDEKPASGFVLLSINTKGLDFFYQPELTQREIDGGCVRPDNVVGSYAVYHQTMKGNYVGGKNYQAGKFCHIYRPHVTDANGKREWCEMNITGAVMKIVIPDELLYPIVVDPTFGCDPASPGNSWRSIINNGMYGALFTSPSNIGTAQSISYYLKKEQSWHQDFNFKGIIVLHSNDNIIANGIGAASPPITSTTPSWKTSTFGTDPDPANSTEYILMGVFNNPQSNYIAYDTGNTNQGHRDTANNYTSPENPTYISHDNNAYSIYCTYTTAAAGGSPAGKALNGSFCGPFGGPIQCI